MILHLLLRVLYGMTLLFILVKSMIISNFPFFLGGACHRNGAMNIYSSTFSSSSCEICFCCKSFQLVKNGILLCLLCIMHVCFCCVYYISVDSLCVLKVQILMVNDCSTSTIVSSCNWVMYINMFFC